MEDPCFVSGKQFVKASIASTFNYNLVKCLVKKQGVASQNMGVGGGICVFCDVLGR